MYFSNRIYICQIEFISFWYRSVENSHELHCYCFPDSTAAKEDAAVPSELNTIISTVFAAFMKVSV